MTAQQSEKLQFTFILAKFITIILNLVAELIF